MKSLYLVVFLASCFAFLGCPTQPAPVQLDPVSQPVVVDEEIPAGMGEVVMEGNILEDKVLDDLNQVVDYLRPYVSQLEVTFYPADMGGVGKAGGGDFWTYEIPVEDDGSYSGRFLVTAGEYIAYVSALDDDGRGLFWADSDEIEVLSGGSASASVMLALPNFMRFRFTVTDLPGLYGDSDYDDGGDVQIVDDDGNVYSGYYSRWGYWSEETGEVESVIIFTAYLPVDFDGEEDGAVMIIRDGAGDVWATELPLSVLGLYCCPDAPLGFPEVSYTFPEGFGEVDLEIGFIEY